MKPFLLTVLLIAPILCFSQLNGKVVSIADGDTFTILTDSNKQIKIRLYGIDCPEKGQDFGQAAKEYTSSLVFNNRVYIESKGVDRYGRTLGIAYEDSLNINEALLKADYAWHYVYFDHNQQWDQYEEKARAAQKGLWLQSNAIAPWEWRKAHK